MASTSKKSSSKKTLLILALSISALLLASIAGLYTLLLNRFYPQIFIADLNLSLKTPTQARQEVASLLNARTKTPLVFNYQNQEFKIDLSPFSNSSIVDQDINQAFNFGHQLLYFSSVKLPLVQNINSPLLQQYETISQSVDQPAVDATLSLSNDEIVASPSQNGLALDEDKLSYLILNYLNTGQIPPNDLPVKTIQPKLSYDNALTIKKELDSLKLNPLTLNFKNKSYTLDLAGVLNLLDLSNSDSILASSNFYGTKITLSSVESSEDSLTSPSLSLNKDKIKAYFQTIAQDLNQDVKEPTLTYDGKKVTEFVPPQEGYSLNIDKAANRLENQLLSGNLTTMTLPVDITPPKNKLVNDLGIKELLAEGVSHFDHSIPNRIFNVELAASRVNGTLVAPGAVFSFNNAVGEVSGATGYKEGYIISNGKTVLDDGGGVCQDSTTLFRAVLNAGLPVVSRTAHAYRVGYYEEDSPPGLDATVFAPSVDFRFKNDTSAYILIETRVVNDDTLYYDLYGTPDGRVATITTPVILSTSPALPDVRQDDPTLPKGTIKQVDFAVAGANVVFSRTVVRNGQTLIQETYHSNYRPWANIYLVGTQ